MEQKEGRKPELFAILKTLKRAGLWKPASVILLSLELRTGTTPRKTPIPSVRERNGSAKSLVFEFVTAFLLLHPDAAPKSRSHHQAGPRLCARPAMTWPSDPINAPAKVPRLRAPALLRAPLVYALHRSNEIPVPAVSLDEADGAFAPHTPFRYSAPRFRPTAP